MNCQSIKNKKAEIHTVIDSAKPDIILGNESWLTPELKNSEIFPDSFDAIRKDRAGDSQCGGVFIAYRRDLLCTETPELDAKCEVVRCKLNIILEVGLCILVLFIALQNALKKSILWNSINP